MTLQITLESSSGDMIQIIAATTDFFRFSPDFLTPTKIDSCHEGLEDYSSLGMGVSFYQMYVS